MALPDTSSPSLVQEDVYSRPQHRWLALLAAVLAWGFDGVEQGVYGIMTRQALKDLVPAVSGLTGQLAALQAQAASGSAEQIAALTQQIDQQVAPFFSLSVAMWLWGAALGGVLFGRFGDRYGRVRGLLLSVTTYATFTGLSAVTTHWTGFMACRFCGAIGLGGTWPLCVALVVETWPGQYRALLAGAIGAAANVGMFIAAIYSRIMLAHGYGWRAIIAMGMLIGLSSLPVIAIVHEPTQWKLARVKRPRTRLAEGFSPAYRRATIVGSLLSTVALLGTWGTFLWLPAYIDQLTEHLPDGGTAKARIMLWQSAGAMCGGFLGGLLAGWFGNRRSYALLCVTAWGSVLALFGITQEYRLETVLLAVVAGIFVTAFFGWLPKYLPELYPTHIRASGQGFSFNIGQRLSAGAHRKPVRTVHFRSAPRRAGRL